ncbi:MAG: DNRLRE domain-containing protein, partial [Planctomycetota bacterium]|nr:DNRLRE domain-containing protein [Planctomycetota bacterium]
SYVRDGTFAGQNFGSAAEILVKRSNTAGNTRESYVKFDVSSLDAGSVESATLRLFGNTGNAAGSLNVSAHAVSDSSWTEGGITWNNKPASASTALQTRTISGTSGAWYEWDVTSAVQQAQAAGQQFVSIALKPTVTTDPWAVFNSDDASSSQPELSFTTSAPPPQSLVVSPGTLTVAEQNSGSFTVKLGTAPTSDVSVTISKDGGGDGDLNADQTTLLFTASNWNVAQTVNVAATEDADFADGQATFSITSTGLASKSVVATENDDDTAPQPSTVETTVGAYVRGGSFATTNYGTVNDLVVKKWSTANETREAYLKFDLTGVTSVANAKLRVWGRVSGSTGSVGLSVYDASNTTWGESTINWNNKPASGSTARGSVTLTGSTAKWYEVDLTTFLKSAITAGNTLVTLVLKGTVNASAPILISSDDTANRPRLEITPEGPTAPSPQNLVVSTGNVTVDEGSQTPFTVKLATAPTSDVTVTIAKNGGGDADLSSNPTTLTFTAANWNVAQSVNVAAAEDADTSDGQATFTIASSGLTSKSVVATEDDDDTPTPQALVLSHTALTVAEGSKSLFTVKLAAAPTANMTVTISKNAGGDPDLISDKSTLTFTPQNWDVAQQVAINGAADPDTADGNATFTIASTGVSSKSIIATEDDDDTTRQPGTYYVNLNGNDANAGTAPDHAWQSIAKLNAMVFIPGDTVLFRGEQSFNGTIRFDNNDSGTNGSGTLLAPITLGSYGTGSATISSGSSAGFFAQNNGGITLRDLNFRGAGIDSNNTDGVTFFNNASGNVKQSGITLRGVTVSGYGQNGLGLGGFNGTSGYRDVELTDSQFFENRDGITLYGPAFNAAAPAYVNQNVRVANVLAYDNHGRSGMSNPTGNGIVFGSVSGGVTERSVAHHNGADNTSVTGPVGICAYNSDRVTIQYNESYSNRRGTGGDGDGFDFDQNTSNSVMQYNYAHDNDGAGYLIYTGQNNGLHDNNTVRYNVSERDGRTNGYGGVVIGGRVTDLDVYNNTIYFPSGSFGTNGAAIFITSIGDRVHVRNNILYTTGGARLISTPDVANELLFQRNVYFPGGGATAIRWGGSVHTSVGGWLNARTEQERVDLDDNGSLDIAALTVDPRLTSPGNGGTIGNANNLGSLSAYKLRSDSPLRDAGLDLQSRFGIDPGDLDFYGTTIKQGSGFDLGADEF